MGKPFQPGNPGGPGRPKGSRNKLSEAFLDALHQDFQAHGVNAIAQARAESPLGYVRMVAALLPQKVEVQQGDLSSLTDAELNARLNYQLASVIGLSESADASPPLCLPHVT